MTSVVTSQQTTPKRAGAGLGKRASWSAGDLLLSWLNQYRDGKADGRHGGWATVMKRELPVK